MEIAEESIYSFLNIFRQNITATLIKDIRAKAQINMNIISGLSKNPLNLLFIIIKYKGDILTVVYISEKEKTSVIIDNIKNNPQINIDVKVTFEVSSFLFNKGETKNKKNKPLNANILLAPERNKLLTPLPNIGRERSNFNKSITNIKVNNMLNKAIGTIIVFDLIIDFPPIKFATTPINKNKKIINAIG